MARGPRGDVGGLAAWIPGTFVDALRRCETQRPPGRTVPARVGEHGRVNRGSPASELGQRQESLLPKESPSLGRMTAIPGVGP